MCVDMCACTCVWGHNYVCVCVWTYAFVVVVVVAVASEGKDPVALRIFHSAGMQLGTHVRALIPKADKVGHVGHVEL